MSNFYGGKKTSASLYFIEAYEQLGVRALNPKVFGYTQPETDTLNSAYNAFLIGPHYVLPDDLEIPKKIKKSLKIKGPVMRLPHAQIAVTYHLKDDVFCNRAFIAFEIVVEDFLEDHPELVEDVKGSSHVFMLVSFFAKAGGEFQPMPLHIVVGNCESSKPRYLHGFPTVLEQMHKDLIEGQKAELLPVMPEITLNNTTAMFSKFVQCDYEALKLLLGSLDVEGSEEMVVMSGLAIGQGCTSIEVKGVSFPEPIAA